MVFKSHLLYTGIFLFNLSKSQVKRLKVNLEIEYLLGFNNLSMVMGKLLGAMDLILDFNNSLRSKPLNRNINDKDKEKQETTKKKYLQNETLRSRNKIGRDEKHRPRMRGFFLSDLCL